MTVAHFDENLRLRAAVRDLLALSIIPEQWVAREPPAIVADLADLLIGSLELDFAFVRLCDPTGRQVVEVTRGDSWKAFPEWLEQHLAQFGQISRKEVVPNVSGTEKPCCGIVIPIGVNSERGLVAAASYRSDFSDQIDQQLLSVAANNAATAFQNAFLIRGLRNAEAALRDSEQGLRMARDELEIKVAERTAELRRSEKELRDDIEKRIQAEFELRRSEAYLAEAQRLSHTGSFAWSSTRDTTYFSEECYRVLGFEPSGNPPPFDTIVQRIHPNDQAHCRELVAKALHDKTDVEIDYRIIHLDKTVRNIHCLAHAVLDPYGDFSEFVGTVVDVTERMRAEAKQRRSEIELRQILDLTPQHIGVLGPDGSPLYANREVLDYFGINIDQWRDPSLRVHLVHPDDRELFLTERPKRFLEGVAHEFEVRILRHDGMFRWFLFRLSPLKDDRGQITRWYGTAADIEDRKQTANRLQQENTALREEIDRASMFEEIVGTSPALRAVLSRVFKVAPSDSTVLVTGETGTGKELVARAIHRRSNRTSRGFVSVNCAAIPRDLTASELFGHEKGAFTGAMQRRIGRFELAEGGTIFLDEVGELSAETQVALLRVLQEREFERVGGSQPIHVDVRVIAATNRDLKAAVESGTFRQDLYYRLNVFPLEVPPLRERRKDIPLLVEYFVDRYARKAGKNIRSLDQKTLQSLQSYPWPGNIRELQNVIERSVIVCETEKFSVDESWLSQQPRDKGSASKLYLSQKLAATEKEIIEEALRESQGRVFGPSGAAAKLGIARSTLESKIQALNIKKNRFK